MPRGGKKSKLLDPTLSVNADAVYSAEAIVAVLDSRKAEGYALAKLQDDVTETTDQVRVSFLQESGDNGTDISYSRFSEGDIMIDLILKDVPYKIEKQKGRNKPLIYHIEKTQLEGLAKMAESQQASAKPADTKKSDAPAAGAQAGNEDKEDEEEEEEEDESSEDEEEEEEDGEDIVVFMADNTSRVLKRVRGPKPQEKKKKKKKKVNVAKSDAESEKKDQEEEKEKTSATKGKKKKKTLLATDSDEESSEDDDEDDEYLPVKKKKSPSGKKGAKVSRATKKKASDTGVITTKKVDLDGEEDEDQDEEEDENEDDGKKKKKKKKSTTKKSSEKKSKKMPDTFKKGKFNPKIDIVDYNDLLMNKSDAIIDYGCTKTNNKNLIRAVYTKNHSLLEKILKNNYFLSNLHEPWGPENDITALELAAKMKDNHAMKAILDCEYGRTLSFAYEPPSGLQNVTTGNVSKSAFGVEIRKVNLMRGGREGNNAFTHDLNRNYLDYNSVFEQPLDKEILDYIRLKAGNGEVLSRIDKLVLRGDWVTAGHLVNIANVNGGYGFNYLHEEVLTKTKAAELTPNIKKVSVTKKVIGNSIITPLHCAAINPNTEILDALLKIVPDFSVPDEKMRKLVHYAACCEKPGPLQLLLSKGVDPREKDQTGLTPFMYACYYGRAQNVEVLLKEAQVDPLYKTKEGMMGLHWAAQKGHLEVLKVLVKNGVSMTTAGGKSRMTPLHFAAAYGHFDCVKFLLENKAKVIGKDKLKRSPLLLAVRNGNLEIASYLLHYGADYEQPDSSNNYPIHYAAAYGFSECIEILVKAGADVNAKNLMNFTPLTVAMLKNNFHCVKTLLSYPETDVNAKDDNGRTLVSLLISSFSEDNLEKITFLIKERNCNVNAADLQGITPLHYACQIKAENLATRSQLGIVTPDSLKKMQKLKMQLIKLLLDSGADINAKTVNKEVPMLFAINNFDSELIELLLDHKSIDLAFQDRNENNIYRLLYRWTLDTDEHRKLLEKVISRAGNICNILNEEKKPPAQQQQQQNMGYFYNNYNRPNNASTSTNDPTNSNDSAFTCYKRTLMDLSLQKYLDKEELATKERKRQQMIQEQQLEQQKQQQQQGGLFSQAPVTGGLLGSTPQPLGGGGSLFSNTAPPGGSSLFANIQQPSSGGLFAGNSSGGGLLGSAVGGGGLFAKSSPTAGGGLFSGLGQANNTGGLFSNTTQNNNNLFAPKSPTASGGLFGSNVNQLQGLASIVPIATKPIPNISEIKLTKEEIKAYKDEAHKQFDIAVTKNLLLLEKFVKAGGLLPEKETLLFKEDYHNDPRFMIWLLDSFRPDLNIPNDDGNTGLFHLIYKRNKLNMTPTAKNFLLDYVAGLGTDKKTLEKYSDFRVFIELLHKFGADFNHKNKKGVTPVLYMLRDRDLANAGFLDDLIAYGADVHKAEDNDGSTPFLEAIYAYDTIVIEKLLALNVDVNHKDKHGKAPLHYIAEMKEATAMDTAKILLQQKNVEVDIKEDTNGRTPLHLAIIKSARGLVKVLLNAGADPNQTDKDWSNALYFATQIGDIILMREVSERIADPNFSGYLGGSPLHLAVNNGKPELVEFLLKIGANPNAKDHKGRTVLTTAVMQEKVEIVRLLLKNGGNPNDKDIFERISLHYAVNNSKPEQMFEMEDVLIRNGANINALDMYGRTPLHYAFTPIEGNTNYHNQTDPVETVTSLFAVEKIDLDAKDRRGRRPLHYAAENGAYICILLMLKNEITLDDADADGNTPLALALNSGHKDTAAILIQNKANVTNKIHRVNNQNFLWAHPNDKNYDELLEEYEEKKQKEKKEKKSPVTKGQEDKEEEKPADATDGKMDVENKEKPAEDANEDKDESDDEEGDKEMQLEEEEDDITEELDGGDAQARQLELQDLGSPDEAHPNKPTESKEPLILTGHTQAFVDSFFAISIRKGWQGVAYLLLQNGFNLMEAIKDALNEGKFMYVLALMTKIQDTMLRQTDHNQQNLFHVFAMRGQKAPSDLTSKIFEGLMVRGVDYKAVDSKGKNPLHYAAENNFLFLEAKLLENNVDCNQLDKNGFNILHLALITNTLTTARLIQYHAYNIDLNARFTRYARYISPLHYVAENKEQILEKELLKLGADPNIEDDQGITPLQRVFIQNNLTLDRLKLYVSYYANLNKPFTVTYHQAGNQIKKTYTLLIYAAEKGWSYFEDQLLMYGADASIENDEGKTAFEIALGQASHELTLDRLRLYILNRAPLKKTIPCKIRNRNMKVTPVLYLMNLKHRKPDLVILKELLDSGVSVNDADEDGWTPVIYAIRRNQMLDLQLFLSYPSLDRNMRDKQGKTPIHHLVNPMDYASYENVRMLELLARFFDVNTMDDRKKPPIYYAHFQDSETLVKALLKLGATDFKPAAGLHRQATSIIAGVDWTEDVDYEDDAEKYIAEQEEKKMDETAAEKMPPDTSAHNRQNLEVVYDDELGPYSLFMTKVDIGKGGYGEYLFYRMQVLHDKNRDVYMLFTKWGRIGDDGMFQQTPYANKDECINDFLKIFKDKSGNEWKNKDNFQKVEKKYKLLKTSTRKNQRDYLQPVNWKDKELPKTRLDKSIRKVIKSIADVKLFRNWFGKYHIDEHVLPFGKLSKDLIFEAKKILLDLRELIEELEGKRGTTEEEVQEVLKLKDKIVDRSSKFYELIPDTRFRLTPVQPIDNATTLDEKVRLVNDMLDFEVSSKIMLGALYRIKTKNPLDYCFEALDIRLLTLSSKQREHKLISQYVKNGNPNQGSDFIVNIFALERKGEAERISQWKDAKNRMYLWHGSKLLNFMGILSQGLRIAPPEAPATGYMFGKGIYFADTFAKSYGYCHDWSYNGTNSSKLLLLCEVALGEPLEQFQANYITNLAPPHKSVKGCGRRGPDPNQNIVLQNGAIVPLGTQMNYEYRDAAGQIINPVLQYNEYIVYDVSQVRMRYLVQVRSLIVGR